MHINTHTHTHTHTHIHIHAYTNTHLPQVFLCGGVRNARTPHPGFYVKQRHTCIFSFTKTCNFTHFYKFYTNIVLLYKELLTVLALWVDIWLIRSVPHQLRWHMSHASTQPSCWNSKRNLSKPPSYPIQGQSAPPCQELVIITQISSPHLRAVAAWNKSNIKW